MTDYGVEATTWRVPAAEESVRAAQRLYLSPPHMSGDEERLVAEVFASNWIAPLGPQVDAFEREFAAAVDMPHAVALSSGTAALHLALLLAGVGAGDEVPVSTFTFIGSVSPIVQLGARPIFVDSEAHSWNMDPVLLDELLARKARAGRMPRAVVVVHLYGQVADLDAISDVCMRHGVVLIEDAAEALGASHRERPAGSIGDSAIFSFNGNKIITTSGGGMLVTRDAGIAERARKLATQAREPAAHYEHIEVGFNYRMSNVLAAIGRGQLRVLPSRVAARRSNFEFYRATLGELPGIRFMPEAEWGLHTRWLTTLTVEAAEFGADREMLRLALEKYNIESRPLWKPMHLQPVFCGVEVVGGALSTELFEHGLCLPSGSQMSRQDLERVADIIATCGTRGGRA
jgi:dTDP-4-amino-4,6-dideoxygalactose transaminase